MSAISVTAAYYTQYLTGADGEEPGRWYGAQADDFGLSGTVSTEALERLLSGRDPNIGTGLGYELKDRTLASGKVVRAVSGFDATLSAPKSLSVLWALTGDQRLAECHDVAARAVVEYLERYGATTRVRSNGARLHPDTVGLTVAAFRQTTSRLDDPQLHTHLVISAKVQTVDGRWLALDARFLKGHQRALGGLYQSVLRSELTARVGFAFTEIVNGQAEIVGVPEELLRRFSKRAVQVDAATAAKVAEFKAREGREPSKFERAAMEREASADTRGRKTGNTTPDLRERWLAEAAALGITPQDLVAAARDAARDTSRDNPDISRSLTTGDIIEQLSTSASSWHRMDVLRAVCDVSDPHQGVTGQQWVRSLDRVVDAVLADCIDLDPTPADDVRVRRRQSDGRSVWIEPTANRFTSPLVLAQEEHILAWASHAQPDIPQPSTTVRCGKLDLVQYEAAAAVAGSDGLVVIVGPAGAGKTTMLRAAVDDLTGHGRPVFGLAPSAKAARVLELETGMATDTVAKLLYEWARPDGEPGERWRLAVGTTLVLDEAGMVSTNDLYQLTKLAAQQQWRLALVGDPRQLQAVGRGGMFAEVGTCTKPIVLEQIHRFTTPWEAATSLQLRHGNPAAFDRYAAYDRIVAGTFEDHLDTIANAWMERHQEGGTLAITASTNEHVQAINARIQIACLTAGQLPGRPASAGEEVQVYVGDVVVTRRNARELTTDTGEIVRNRERWTVQAITDDGDLRVRQLEGEGVVVLPADYAAEHVQLGYATTEHGNQGVTQTASLTLATPTTSGRGLYVGMTRGRDNNQVLVVTDTPDPAEARDVLEAIIAFDRVDVPAVSVRRQLAGMERAVPSLSPRCAVPGWFPKVRADAVTELDEARRSLAATEAKAQARQDRWTAAQERVRAATDACVPHDEAAEAARSALNVADHARRDAARAVEMAKFGSRRDARERLAHAERQLQLARTAHDTVRETAAPLWTERARARDEERQAEQRWHNRHLLQRYANPHQAVGRAERLLDALDTWHDWATGKPVATDRLRQVLRDLDAVDDRDWLREQPTSRLADTLHTWADEHGIEPDTLARRPGPTYVEPPQPGRIRRHTALDRDFGIEL